MWPSGRIRPSMARVARVRFPDGAFLSVQRVFIVLSLGPDGHAHVALTNTLIYHRALHHSFLMTRLGHTQMLRVEDISLLYTRVKPRRWFQPTYQAGSSTWSATYQANRQSSFSNCALPYSWCAAPSNGRGISNALVSYVSITKRPSPLW